MLIGESQQAIVFPVEYKLYICYQSGGGGAIITWRLKVVSLCKPTCVGTLGNM